MAKVETRPSLAELVREHTTHKVKRCPIGFILRDHPDEADGVRAILALDKREAQHKAVGKALTDYFGRDVSADAVRRHRDGLCGCSA